MNAQMFMLKDGQLYTISVIGKNSTHYVLERNGNGKMIIARKATQNEWTDTGANFVFVRYVGGAVDNGR